MDSTATNNKSDSTASNVVNAPGNDAASIKNEFMTLMIAQIQNQDPTNPIDSTEYVTQLAQFSQVESLEKMRLSQSTQTTVMENMGIVQSAQLIGKNAMIPASELTIETDSEVIEGKAYLTNAVEDLSIDIINQQNEVVKTLKLGPQKQGDTTFSINPQALGLAPGQYKIEAKSTLGEEVLTADTFIQAPIEKIHFISASGMMMAELGNGLGTISVLEISEVS
ncbi:flagellar hook capping FlgD N-terminal domain-containing protein [Shewanella sp. VB17]|uniref:flagellar hook capping FlgD N-terminal domain-containing protein n=1 Tax=Shewanella sp. VB17 TaxID=2739432 RepID=UPI0035C8E4AC